MGINICLHTYFFNNVVMKEDISWKNHSKFENGDESSYILANMFN